MLRTRFILAALALISAPILFARSADSATVNGYLTTYYGERAPNRQIHFENRITGDIFLVRTGPDASFSLRLPRGEYDLREERGAVIEERIRIGEEDRQLGKVVMPAPLYPPRLFQFQGIGEAIVKSPAPSTANVPITAEGPIESKTPARNEGSAAGPEATPATALETINPPPKEAQARPGAKTPN